MRKPRGTVAVVDGPRVAMRKLEEMHANELYVIGQDNELVGTVRDEDLSEALSRGDTTIEQVVRTDYPRAEADTPVGELFTLSIKHSIPIAVCDNGRLLGVVPRVSLLDVMSRGEGLRVVSPTEGGAMVPPGDEGAPAEGGEHAAT